MTTDVAMQKPWRITALACAMVACILTALYWRTLYSIVTIWWRSGTYAHGFLIVPISAWLVWQKRLEIARMKPKPTLWPLAVFALLGAIWLLARLVEVDVIQQLCAVAMLIAAIVALLGWRASSVIAFPLGFLILAVPMGEQLLAPLMHFTAVFTVKALQLTGIPVFSQGTYIALPNGRWQVAQACSGLRYLFASVTLGFLYAYLMYKSYGRRLLFIGVSVIVPIVANGIRAYMIVMIGYLSGMKLAVGIDHVIYGWVLFGIIIGILFYIGSFWREDHLELRLRERECNSPLVNDQPPRLLAKTILTAFSVVALAFTWQFIAMRVDGPPGVGPAVSLQAPLPRKPWSNARPPWHWKPRYVRPQAQVEQAYTSKRGVVVLYLEYYGNQRQGQELIDFQNVLVPDRDSKWRVVSTKNRTIRLDAKPAGIRETYITSESKNLLVWQWYWISGEYTDNDYLAKLLEVKGKILGRHSQSASIILASDFDMDPRTARDRLKAFVREMSHRIEESLRAASPTDAARTARAR